MFSLLGTAGLVGFILARPTDLFDSLRNLPLLYVFVALALLGLVIDIRYGYLRWRWSPPLVIAGLFFGWCLFTSAVFSPGDLGDNVKELAIVLVVVFFIGQAPQSLRALEVIATTVLVCSLFIAVVVVHQGTQPNVCVAIDPADGHTSMGRPDDRPCRTITQCYISPPEPQSVYRCEHHGAFGLTSIGHGRVRYAGVLHDPNEVALTVCAAIPLALGLYRRRKRRLAYGVVFALMLGFAFMATIYSQSRGGILVMLAALGVFFIERFGLKGAVGGGLAGLPLLLLGGRSGGSADASTNERIECWFTGMRMFVENPFVGVGYNRFTEHHHLTAHNSVVLAAAENGFVGLLLWTSVIYFALKMSYQARIQLKGPEKAVARDWSMAILGSTAAVAVGSFFLSFNYHYVFWIYLAMAGTLYRAIRRHEPRFECKFGVTDLALLFVANSFLVVALYGYTAFKLS
ncbi:MAG: O-antigen ligase family protein [Myxococcota bacterium]